LKNLRPVPITIKKSVKSTESRAYMKSDYLSQSPKRRSHGRGEKGPKHRRMKIERTWGGRRKDTTCTSIGRGKPPKRDEERGALGLKPKRYQRKTTNHRRHKTIKRMVSWGEDVLRNEGKGGSSDDGKTSTPHSAKNNEGWFFSNRNLEGDQEGPMKPFQRGLF